MSTRFTIAGIAVLMLAACSPPEATRQRGSGPGGDTGNRPAIVRMHEGSRPYEHIPKHVPGEMPPLDTASQARSFGRR